MIGILRQDAVPVPPPAAHGRQEARLRRVRLQHAVLGEPDQAQGEHPLQGRREGQEEEQTGEGHRHR